MTKSKSKVLILILNLNFLRKNGKQNRENLEAEGKKARQEEVVKNERKDQQHL